jgi:hypothetical protein
MEIAVGNEASVKSETEKEFVWKRGSGKKKVGKDEKGENPSVVNSKVVMVE